jgi:hypothetical protein
MMIILFLYEDIEIIKIYYIFSGSARLGVLIPLIFLIIKDTKSTEKSILSFKLSLFCFSVVCGYFIAKFILSLKFFAVTDVTIKRFMDVNIFLIGVILASMFYLLRFNTKTKTANYSFGQVVNFVKIEYISGFVVFYVMIYIMHGYELYDFSDNLALMIDGNIKYIMCFLLLCAIYFTNKFLLYYDQNLSLIVIGLVLLTIFYFIKDLPNSMLIDFFVWSIIFWCLYQIVACNIVSILKKMDEHLLWDVLLGYSTSCVFGFFCGYFIIVKSGRRVTAEEFLYSTAMMIGAMVIYVVVKTLSKRRILK